MIPDYLMLDPKMKVIFPRCPVCGKDCDTVYKDRDGTIFACENCVTIADAYDEEDLYVSEQA